jgi:hypothetical protein
MAKGCKITSKEVAWFTRAMPVEKQIEQNTMK